MSRDLLRKKREKQSHMSPTPNPSICREFVSGLLADNKIHGCSSLLQNAVVLHVAYTHLPIYFFFSPIYFKLALDAWHSYGCRYHWVPSCRAS